MDKAEFQSYVSEQLAIRLAKNALDIPMLPRVASDVIRLTQDPESGIAELAKLIQSDQSLAAHVMRVANSAAFSANGSIVSLQQAMARLGMATIAEIALAACVNTKMFNAPGFEPYIKRQLAFSLAAGLWAKEVARQCRKNVEAAFLAGLLHDIGKPVTIHTIIEMAEASAFSPEPDVIAPLVIEHHRAIGLHVVNRWELPATVCSSIKFLQHYHHEHESKMLTMMVAAGATIAKTYQEVGTQAEESLMSENIFGHLNLYTDQVQQILQKHEHVNNTLGAMTA